MSRHLPCTRPPFPMRRMTVLQILRNSADVRCPINPTVRYACTPGQRSTRQWCPSAAVPAVDVGVRRAFRPGVFVGPGPDRPAVAPAVAFGHFHLPGGVTRSRRAVVEPFVRWPDTPLVHCPLCFVNCLSLSRIVLQRRHVPRSQPAHGARFSRTREPRSRDSVPRPRGVAGSFVPSAERRSAGGIDHPNRTLATCGQMAIALETRPGRREKWEYGRSWSSGSMFSQWRFALSAVHRGV